MIRPNIYDSSSSVRIRDHACFYRHSVACNTRGAAGGSGTCTRCGAVCCLVLYFGVKGAVYVYFVTASAVVISKSDPRSLI